MTSKTVGWGLAVLIVGALCAWFLLQDGGTGSGPSREGPPSGSAETHDSTTRRERDLPREDRNVVAGDGAPVVITVRGGTPAARVVVAGADIALMYVPEHEPAQPEEPTEVRTAATDAEGTARLEGLRTGTWRVMIRARGHLGVEQACTLRAEGGDGAVSWDFELDALARVRGRVTSPDGAPAEGVAIRLIVPDRVNRTFRMVHPEDSRERRGDIRTSSSGEFDAGIAPVGEDLTLLCDHGRIGRATVEVSALEAGELRTVDVRLKAHTVITGRLHRAPRDGEIATIECIHRDREGLAGEQRHRVEQDGRFTVSNVIGGTKLLVGMIQGDGWIEFSSLEAAAIAETSTEVGALVPGPHALRIDCVVEGDPPADRRVAVSVIALREGGGTDLAADLRIPPGGGVDLRGLPGGAVLLSAEVADGTAVGRDANYGAVTERVPLGGASDRVALVMKRIDRSGFGTLTVDVEPPPGVTTERLDAYVALARGDVIVASKPAHPKGLSTFDFRELPSGRYTVLAVANGHRADPIDVEVSPGRTTRLVSRSWTRATVVSGRVVDTAGQPVANEAVELGGPGRDEHGIRLPLIVTVTDADGRFTMTAAPDWEPIELRLRDSAESVAPPTDASAVELTKGGPR